MDTPHTQVNVSSEAVGREEVKATIEAAVAPVRADLKWLRWITAALAAATASPKLGGPELPGALLHVAAKFWG